MKPILIYVASEDWAFVSHRLPMARAARDAGFDVHVATSVGSSADAIRAEGFTIHPIPFRRGGLSPLSAISTILALRKIKRTLSPSIVHHVGMQICVLGGISSLGMTTPQVNAMTGLGYAFTSTTARALLLRIVIAVALRFLLNRDHAIFLVQNPDDRAALETIGIDPNRLVRIPGSGVDTDKLLPMPEPAGPITVGFAGRLLTSKGIRALVGAHRILRALGVDVRLRIAGDPDLANPDSVSFEDAKQWNNEPGITWLGHVYDITSLWRDSHIAALPSHREGLPKSLLEAAACARPLIATDAPGCREIAIHDQTGLLVPIENPQALADAIGKLATSPELRMRYGAAARRLVVEKMSAQAIGAAIVDLYNEQIQRTS
ncbi:glycosyltransferase family 4 protein [Bradyrhizobium sp. G127]|uniref:glycosyltransferase family 4 protein n=1 Tax=Bradyrhizobium sp. G127 TaxID=2904800 RepID=UPI001F206879|nr:glycosyltransferase family 4 protein [Bradyrhizobium sp. G127]MCF2524468.1 glycosyltransferase family 4 protein [Bradyrhizobium sp. G127]